MTDIGKLLSEDVPPEYITQRAGGGGIKLDYVTGRYVKQRLNEIFGWENWDMEVLRTQLFPDECTAFSHVRLTVRFLEDLTVVRDGLAYGHGRKGAEGFDFAIAESVTDALKRAAVTLGQNLGLSLYPLAKGKKVDPAAHSIADQPQKDGQVHMFSLMIGGASTMDDLAEVWSEINAAKSKLGKEKTEMLEMLKDSQKRKLQDAKG